ncbi:hypothetical protein ACKAV7_003420 [Fusarium commune]
MKELDPALYTIAWIAPLEIEAQAALHMLDNRHDGKFPISRGDDYVFLAGDINGHNIVIATLPPGQEYGTGSAAALASQIKKFFTNLWFGLLVGVAAGLPNLRKIPPIDIRLGDVLVGLSEGDSAGLVAYDLGKETSEGFQLLRFGQVLANTETVVRSAIGNIKIRAPDDTDVFLPFYERIKDKEHSRGTFADPGQEKDIFYDIGDDGVDSPVQRMQRPTHRRTRVWYGSIGSGDKLTKNTLKRNEIRDRYGVIGLEMEAAGTMKRIPVGVIRGVCDYADQHKNKEWQPYAAAMAAAYAKAVIYELGPGKVMPSFSMINEAKHALCGTILCDLPPTTDRFFGRETELLEMVKCLEGTTHRKGVVICGISGSGKTQLAREYVAQRSGKFSTILWIDATSDESIEESVSTCLSRIYERTPDFRAAREITPPLSDAARHAAKLLDGFPLALELAGVLHQRGVVLLDEFAEAFTSDYPELAQFEIDSGVWIWTRNGVIDSLFSMLDSLYKSISMKSKESALLITFCSIYGPSAIPISLVHNLELIHVGDTDDQSPWKQLQALAQSKLKLNRAIDELSKVFLATKKQANDHTLMSFSVHASICQWRLATMEDRDVWIIQATYSLSKHILSLHEKSHIFKFFNLFNRCLDLLWKHIDACRIEIYGKFAEAYFTICLCGADVYLSMGKSEIAKTLFTSAIDYIRSSSPSDPDENMLLRLLCGLAKSFGLVSRVKALRDHMLTLLENRKRALIASTGPKLAPPMNSSAESLLEFEDEELYRQLRKSALAKDGHDSPASSSDYTTGIPLPNMAWELRFSHPILVFSLQDDGKDFSGLSDAFPMTIQGRLNVMTYENIDIKSIHIEINLSGMSAWNVGGQRKGLRRVGDLFYFNSWKLKLFDAPMAPHTTFGDNCTFRLDDENYQENTRRPKSDGIAIPDHISFPPGSYSYSFETPVDCLLTHVEKSIHGDINWTAFAVIEFLNFNPRHSLRKELPVIQIPRRPTTRRFTTTGDNDEIAFSVDLPYKISPIGSELPITVSLGPVKNGFRAEYLSYSIVQTGERWTQDRATRKTDHQELVFLERFKRDESTTDRDDNSNDQDGEETIFSSESDASLKALFEKRDLPNLDPDEPVSISDDLILPTFCGCPDADSFEECFSWNKMPPKDRPINAKLLTETSVYTREIYGGSEDDVRRKNTRLEEVWSQPIRGSSKSQHWEALHDISRNSGTSGHSVDDQTSDLHTAEDTLQSYGCTTDPRDEPPPYSD